MTILTWIVAAILWVGLVWAFASWAWGWRRAIGIAMAAAMALMTMGLFVALVWRATEWWLGIILAF